MKRGRLEGKVAIVTGAAGGIGRATVRKMIDERAVVVVADVREDAVAKLERELTDSGARALGVVADVADRKAVEKMVEQVLARFGTVDVLVNNAGVARGAELEAVRDEDWQQVVQVNLMGSANCAQAVLPTMKARRYGKIVNIGSRVSLGKEKRTVYSATKAGLIGMTRTWALELARHGINVNYVGPGTIATEMFTQVNPADAQETVRLVNAIPLGRMGSPEDVANLIAFLASDESSFITGQSVFICGGTTVGAVHF